MPTFIVANNTDYSDPISLSPEDEHHLLQVLRYKIGDCFSVTNNQGNFAQLKITCINPLEFEIIRVLPGEPPYPLTVCLSLIQKDRFEWAVQKLCELNIQNLQPITTERSQLKELSPSFIKRLNKISKEAQKQCGRTTGLNIKPLVSLNSFDFSQHNTHVMASFKGQPFTPFKTPEPLPAAVFIGPEGGFTDSEEQWLEKNGVQKQQLWGTTLKAETAAVVMATLWRHTNPS